MYCRHSVGAHSPSALNQLYQSLNNPALQQLISEISGEQIIHTSAQATRYISGQYLTRHTDVVESEGRVYAYVLGVSKTGTQTGVDYCNCLKETVPQPPATHLGSIP